MQAVGIIFSGRHADFSGDHRLSINAKLLSNDHSRYPFSVISSVGGTFISFHIDGATGPSIVPRKRCSLLLHYSVIRLNWQK